MYKMKASELGFTRTVQPIQPKKYEPRVRKEGDTQIIIDNTPQGSRRNTVETQSMICTRKGCSMITLLSLLSLGILSWYVLVNYESDNTE